MHADDTVRVCHGYGCQVETEITISEVRWQALGALLGSAVDAVAERRMLAEAMGQLYAWAGEQSPIHNDRGGNYADGGVSGAMDCVDHATTSTRFLKVLARRGLLRRHRVLDADVRRSFYVFVHYSAVIEELPLSLQGEGSRFAVDSWFVDNGKPAVILPLEDWKKGAGPDV